MKEYVFYADDGTRFSSVVERNHYNELLKKKKENRENSNNSLYSEQEKI